MKIRNIWGRGAALMRRLLDGEVGMLTAEYAMTTVAACGAAGILYKVLTSDSFTSLIADLFKRALIALF